MDDIKELSLKKQRKNAYWAKLETAMTTYNNILIITVDFVGSRQMQTVRAAIRGQGTIIMGKNTIMRKVIRDNSVKKPDLLNLLPLIKGNMGMIFVNDGVDLNSIRKTVSSYKMPAAAKSGVVAPKNVSIPAGPTGLDPGQTSFFQTLNVNTKISKGSIEITSEVQLCFQGEKVTASAVALLSKLGIKPFEFGIVCGYVYESGSVYDASVLDLETSDLINMFCGAVASLAAISFEIGKVNATTIPHSFGRAFNILVAIALETEYEFDELTAVKEALANPGAGAAGAAGAAGDAAAAPVVEEEEEEEAAPAMDMFGGDEGGDAEDY